MVVHGIIFDMDGLMFDSEKLYNQANIEAAKEMKLPFPDDYYERFIGASDDDMMAFFDEAFGGKEQTERFMELTYQRINELVRTGHLKKKPGLDDLLDYLDQQKIAKIIASSNFKSKINEFLVAGGISDRFSKIVSVDKVKAGKPAPDLFLQAQTELALPKEQVLILEDSANGLLAAKAASIDCLIVPDLIQPTDEMKRQAVAVLPNLGAVKDYLKKINR
ncbi:HAD family hydrolase [Loigolactobacillus iwatensis]|uniref:HAD family hydrolase n=1 Tax=Loigolactobacillus iwatensis TaxID=1267156 RepID=UPI000F7F68FC|nr:HAD family phosphatase [Loigolactobacillus iwatensis]